MNEAIAVSLISLGCARNLVDSEVLLGHAVEEGFTIAREPEDADVVVVNTCGFIEAAKQESIDTILSVARLKEGGRLKGVVAVGCLSERYGDTLRKEIPELDAVLGISDYSGIPEVIRKIVNGSGRRFAATISGGKPRSATSDRDRVLLTPKSYAYLRISEGCDHSCSFCAIPSMRGRNRSKPPEVLVEEAEGLARAGVREIVVVAEDSTAYGLDLFRKRALAGLLERLAQVGGIEWIRVMYAYPHTVDRALTSILRDTPKLVPYLDMPVQHISGNMLRAMRRGVSAEQVKGILWRLRDEVPGIAVRSTFIVGHPGESEEDFEELMAFTEEYRFERLGVFTFSREEGTPSHDLPDQVDPALAEYRRSSVMALQRGILDEQNTALVGETRTVLIDGRGKGGDGYVGRTTADAPEVDCVVRIEGDGVQAGDMVRARITGVDGYDLVGRVVRQPSTRST